MSHHGLERFRASSANDEHYMHLWVKGASVYIPRLLDLLKLTGYTPAESMIEDFQTSYSTELGHILGRNYSDKSTTHNYHILYSYILNKLGRDKPLNVLEVGLGTNNPSLVSTMGGGGRPGASLYSWREYLPNAQIYGGDVDKDILFQDDRIRTHHVDQLDMDTFIKLQESFDVQYDMIIDDGLHSIGANINTLLFGLKHVKDNGWVIIEDISSTYIDNWYPIDYILRQNPNYECCLVRARSAYMYVVHKKSS